MGTRHLIAVVKDKKYVVAQYGQWDGYLSGQGKDILSFLKNDIDRKKFENNLDKVSYATSDELQRMWKEAGADDSEFIGMEVSDKFKEMYPENSRDTGANILNIIKDTNKPLKIVNDINFPKDGLMCDYAYVIDFDNSVFEVYRGFNEEPLVSTDRFYSENPNKDDKYYVKLLVKFDFDNLPNEEEFLAYDEDDEDEDE